MARKSKGKFNMKGHSFPGIKGCKTTTLEDGRAASSAFQMQESPLYQTDAPKLGDDTETETETTEGTESNEGTETKKKSVLGDGTKMETGLDQSKEELDKDDPFSHHQRSKQPGESGVEFGMRAWAEAAQRIKAKKDAEKKSNVEKMDDVIDSSESNPIDVKEVNKIESPETADPLADQVENKEIKSPEVKDNTPDFSSTEEFGSVNDLVAERELWEEKNPEKRFPGQDEINKRLKEDPNKWG